MTWLTYDERRQRLTLIVHVQPNARHTAIAGLHGDALKVRVHAPAVDNQANAALAALLSAVLDVPAATITIAHGSRHRRKVIEIHPASSALLHHARQVLPV